MSQTYQIQSSEIGSVLTFNFVDSLTNAAISLTGGSVALYGTAPAIRGNPVKQSYACMIQPGGATATYTTTGNDFVTVGRWQMQAVFTLNGTLHHGPIFYLNVLSNL